MYYNAALVLEGGAMRGLYTSGVLDTFLEHDIQFDCVIGVSAGSLNGANFVSKQYQRTYNVNVKYRKDHDYISLARPFKHESIINLDFLFDDHGLDWHNFDNKAYLKSETDFIVVATSLESGKAVTLRNPQPGQDLIDALEASSSMPFISKPHNTSKGLCLDGGIANSIPFDIAQKMGFQKIIVVRTRPRDYRKKPTSFTLKRLYSNSFKEYPEFVKTAIRRPEMYNHSVEVLNKLEHNDKIFCLAPNDPVKVGRLEHNTKKMTELYNIGRNDAESNLEAMLNYLQKSEPLYD